jgi:hypothetical protein
MTKSRLAILVPLLALATLHAQNITGDWEGTLRVQTAELRLVLHVTKDDTGRLKATLDSIDQDADDIPVTSISLADSNLNFSVLDVHGTYQGKINADATAIDGTWTQLQSLPLSFHRLLKPIKTEHKLAKPSDIDGAWWGTLENGAIPLRMVFHITNTEDGLVATADSPDQKVKGLPVTAVTRNGSSLKLEMKQLGGIYEGKLDASLSSIDGTWTQAGRILSLTLKRLKNLEEMEPRRPQNPVKPYPYREEEVSYENKPANVKFAATLTIPPGKGPFPAIFLITGSGPQDRDESLMGHKPFLVLSDYLTRKGIVVLRADDRGFGKSTGVFSTATTLDFASDAEAALAYLKSRPEVDSQKIGLIGHSEGGVIAPMVAAINHDVAFIVMLAGTGVPGDQILIAQKKLIEEASGVSHEQAEKDDVEERDLLALVKHQKDTPALENELREKLSRSVSEPQLTTQVKFLSSAWLRYFVEYDPANALSKVTCPVLAINGEKDLQVPPELNLPAIRKALEASGNKKFEVVELPGLNHLFQAAKTGSPMEYGQIEETMSPVALEKIAGWILKQTRGADSGK